MFNVAVALPAEAENVYSVAGLFKNVVSFFAVIAAETEPEAYS